jgi:hypothetical protein
VTQVKKEKMTREMAKAISEKLTKEKIRGIYEQIKLDWQQHTESLKLRLGDMTDFKAEFDKALNGFVENDLPHDDLYNKIEKRAG